MDTSPRFARSARRFLEALIRKYGPDAPAILRGWADELERACREIEIEIEIEQERPCH